MTSALTFSQYDPSIQAAAAFYITQQNFEAATSIRTREHTLYIDGTKRFPVPNALVKDIPAAIAALGRQNREPMSAAFADAARVGGEKTRQRELREAENLRSISAASALLDEEDQQERAERLFREAEAAALEKAAGTVSPEEPPPVFETTSEIMKTQAEASDVANTYNARRSTKKKWTLGAIFSAVAVGVGLVAIAALVGVAIFFSAPLSVPILVGLGVAAGVVVTGATVFTLCMVKRQRSH